MLWKEILEIRWKAAIGLLVFCTLAAAVPGLFWYIENDEAIKAQLQALPPELVGPLTDYQSLVHSNWFGSNVLQVGTVIAVIFGCTTIAGEVSKRTVEFLLSKPVSRLRVLLTKVAVGVTALGAILLISTVLIYPISVVLGFSISLFALVLASVLSWLGLSVMFLLTVLFSTIFDDVIKTAIASLVAALVLAIPGWFESISRFSIYSHMQDYASFQRGTIPMNDVAFLLVAFAVLVSASYVLLRAKEF